MVPEKLEGMECLPSPEAQMRIQTLGDGEMAKDVPSPL